MRRSYEKGVISRKYSLSRYDVQIPGRAYPWAQVGTLNPQHFEEGEVVTLGFVGRRPLPVILNQKPWPRSVNLPPEIPSLNRYAPWLRLGARSTGRYFPEVAEGTRIVGTTPTPAPERISVRIARAWTGEIEIIATAFGRVVTQTGQSDSIEGEDGASIVALWESGGAKLALVEGPVVVEEGYGDGFDAGNHAGYNEATTPSGESSWGAGWRACEEGSGYDPLAEYVPPDPPPGHNEDWNEGWTAGHLAGWTDAWETGYRAGGCEP